MHRPKKTMPKRGGHPRHDCAYQKRVTDTLKPNLPRHDLGLIV